MMDSSYYYRKDTLTKVHYGLKIGANFNQIGGDSTFKKDYTPGFAAGGFIASERKRLGIRAEVMVSSARYNIKNDSSNNDAYFSVLYADINALLEFAIIPKVLWIQAGPQFSSFITVSQHPEGKLEAHNRFSSSDFSAVGGLEARFAKHFSVGARYVYGFSDLRSDISINSTSQEWKTNSIHIYAGYTLK